MGYLKHGCFGPHMKDDDDNVQAYFYGPEIGYSGKYRDDIIGQVLRDDLVQKARATELPILRQEGRVEKGAEERSSQSRRSLTDYCQVGGCEQR